MDSTLTETTAIEATVNGARAADKETVTSLVARGMDPEKAVTTIFTEQAVGLKAETKIHDNYAHEQLDLDAVAKKGNFPYRPSDMFLRMYAAAVDAAEKEPKTAVCSPSLLGSSGVCTLSIVSVIPDIMQHYHNIIVTAQKEVLIATNAWEPGKSVELVTTALQELNDRAAKDGRRVVVKVLMDAANIRNAIQSRFEKKPSTWSKMGIPHDRLDNIDLDLMNYHIAPLGTFHSKFAVIDRQIALVNSNNINIRSNVEMMCQYEGDIVNSLYDAFIISWGKQMDPPLPCISTPAVANRDFHFGDRKAYLRQDTSGSTTTGHTQSDGSKGQLDGRTMDDTHMHDDHAGTPAKEIREESERYDKENHSHTTVPITERLNVMKLADATIDGNEGGMDFKPFYFHSPHDPVPMALVNRQPQPIPGHHDLHNPQNAVWLQALKLANKEVFIQSPVFNASPVVEAVLEACKRGVTVTLYIGLGFNDFAEGIVPFQGGTNDTVRGRMQAELTSCNKQQYLKWHWYVAKDQNAPLRFEKQSRNNHVKFLQVDGQVAVQGSGNMDTQSWFHSQEVNVMVDSPQLVKEWMENFAANQNTGKYGLTDENGKLVSGKPVPEKKGIGGISRSSGGFL